MPLDPLLKTKLFVPRERPDIVRRPRLVERLNAGLGRRLTVFSAPAGFGKTTLLQDWIRQVNQPAAWLSLDAGDNEPARFVSYFIAALQTIQPAFAQDLLLQMQAAPLSVQAGPLPSPLPSISGRSALPAVAGGPDWMHSVLTTLANELSALPAPFVLILDDYHTIESPAIHEAVTFLVDHAPPQMHLAVASRSDPPLPLPRLRARRQLNELREADLRFSPGEATAFLNEVMGLGLAPADVAALEARTEGWIAGLQLAALALQPLVARQGVLPGSAPTEVQGFIRAFTGSHRYILDYLTDEVLRHQPEHIQDFVLHTSILDRMAGDLCDAVTGRRDGQATLERLEASNLFIIPLDGERRWYRYHSLFSDLLRHRLEQTAVHADPVPDLHRRACEWYANHDRLYEAMGHALAAKDYERAAGLVETAGPIMAMRGEAATLLRWLDALPDRAVRARPRISLSYAWTLFVTSNMEAIEPRLQEALRALGAAPEREPRQVVSREPVPALDGRRPEGQADLLLGEVTALRAFIAVYRGDTQRAITLCEQVLAGLPPAVGEGGPSARGEGGPSAHGEGGGEQTPLARAGIYSVLGDAYFQADRLAEAQRSYKQALEWSQVSGSAILSNVMLNDSARLKVAQGKLHEAARLFQGVLDWGASRQVPLYPVGQAYVGLGDLYREWDDPQAAESHLTAGIEHCRRGGYTRYVILGALSLARMMAVRGDATRMQELVDQADQMAHGTGVPGFVSQVAAHRARLWLIPAVFRLAPAVQWLQSCGLTAEDRPHFSAEQEYLTLARVLLAAGRGSFDSARAPRPTRQSRQDVRRLLTRLLQAAEAAGRQRSVVKILTLLAVACRTEGETDRALTTLEQALALAEPEGYVRVLVDEGLPMVGLLRQILARGVLPDYTGRLLSAFGLPSVEGESQRSPAPDLPERLTERELEVLRLLAAGRSNAAIAGELTVTLTTVKAHVRNILRKLDVENRTQAATRARELGLL